MFVAPKVRLAIVVWMLPVLVALASAPAALAGRPAAQPLNPPPPDIYTCAATGSGTICRAHTIAPYQDESTGIICGSGPDAFEVLDSGTRDVRATRWYDTDGNLTTRERTFLFRGTHLSNPITGAAIYYAQHNADLDVLATPGDFDSSTVTSRGHLTITAPGFGVVALESGRVVIGPSGDIEFQSGRSDIADYFNGQIGVLDDLCDALGG